MKRLRLRFSKTGRLKYIGHLDLLDIFNRAIKSAKLPVDYSKGFNPHMLISFASPLSLGIESVSEYVDIDFLDCIDIVTLKDKINEKFPENLEITDVFLLAMPYKRIASTVATAKYSISKLPVITDEQIKSFMSQEKIEVIKKTKRKNELTDIMPDIIDVSIHRQDESETELSAILSCGSFKNLKPTLFTKALLDFLGIELPLYKIKIVRTEIFCGNGTEPLSEGHAAASGEHRNII